MARLAWAACAASVLLSAAAQGETRPEVNGPTQAEMNRQAAARYAIADRELNALYRRLLETASPDGRRRLQAAQRAWIVFRDKDCDARAGSRGGSFHPAAVALCLEHLSDRRRGALQSELDCAEGDLSCGGTRE